MSNMKAANIYAQFGDRKYQGCIFKDRVMIAKWKCGSLLGQKGQTIKAIQTISGTKILVDQQHEIPVCHISGPSWNSVQFARRIMQDIGNKSFKGFSLIRDFADVHQQLQSCQELTKQIPLAIYVPSRGFITHCQVREEFQQISTQNGAQAGQAYLRGNWHSMSGSIFVYTTHSGFLEYSSQDFLPYLISHQQPQSDTQQSIQMPTKLHESIRTKLQNQTKTHTCCQEPVHAPRFPISYQPQDSLNFAKLHGYQSGGIQFLPDFQQKNKLNMYNESSESNAMFQHLYLQNALEVQLKDQQQKILSGDQYQQLFLTRDLMQEKISSILQRLQA
eukprot:TRINITY_DN23946_c0_g1_i3.p1 TRINITY_DN23946_c0_g1~~TRINITY_DN23946_c0_g1_i3.p1  ORF type:complete len:339 (-),score=15.21 TRINITY_DN23946_c0_g1_i3:368-1363(-)